MRIGTKILRACAAQRNFPRENKKLTGCTYQVIPLVETYKYPLGSWILLVCYQPTTTTTQPPRHQRKAGNYEGV